MTDHSITLILNQLRLAGSDDERQAAAAKLYRCYHGQVEKIARGRLLPGGGLADEEDVAQSAFRSFFDRIETGQLDALVSGGQAWAILARLTRNKAIDSVRYDNALCRGGEGARRSSDAKSASDTHVDEDNAAAKSVYRSGGRNRLAIGDSISPTASSSQLGNHRVSSRREEYPLEAVRDRNQVASDEQAASNEAIDRFLEQLSEATLRGIVSLKLQGFTNEEIAEKLGCATRTVERKLNLIRRLWIPILESPDEQRSP
ncbi:sigma-70 family RNA polymerase sigma factor [Stieleria sp. TO1_6]|uniref:sigma-70 family RNA polymerase sigma factor n=1 Tax=Stieleria tagensis TaxID=2956795 RepID=UPI00209AEA60|nr:sigma-70 family RNA polymerase sigma factor [Stieleria tagensis]MCO8121442.1 sigma-70 family RNA polymerase sigma factor [Stieleria tagensis]